MEKIEIRDTLKASFIWLRTGERPTCSTHSLTQKVVYQFATIEPSKKALADFFDGMAVDVRLYTDHVKATKKLLWDYKNSRPA